MKTFDKSVPAAVKHRPQILEHADGLLSGRRSRRKLTGGGVERNLARGVDEFAHLYSLRIGANGGRERDYYELLFLA